MEELKEGVHAEIGRYIKAAREKRGLSKFKASLALGYKSDGTINAIEQGRMPIPVEKIHAVADLYGIELEDLLDKLQECEPELYAKYVTLERAFYRSFTGSIMRAGSGLRGQMARHHRPFRGSREVDISKFTRTIYYPNLEIQPLADTGRLADAGIPPWIADEVLKERMHHEDRV
jgi:transcriptional regulator with XRE-family HTH domain